MTTSSFKSFLVISCLLLLPVMAPAQTKINGAAGPPPAATMLAGPLAAMPSTCSQGSFYYASDQPAGSQFYACSTNTTTFAAVTCDADHRGNIWFVNGALNGDSYLSCIYDGNQYKLAGVNDLQIGNIFTSTEPGLVPASGGDPTKFLSADGSFKVPAGSGVPSGAVNVLAYNWTEQPGGVLTAGTSATINLSPCPAGINASDPGLWVYITGGSGAAEAVKITGGTCTGGASSGTLTFTPANSHSGAWQASSAFAGIYEAIQANPGRKIYAPVGHYPMYACMTVGLGGNGLYLVGDGFQSGENSHNGGGTDLDFSNVTGCSQYMTIQGESGAGGNPNLVTLKDLELRGPFTGNSGNGLYLPDYNQSAKVTLDGVEIEGFGGDGVYANKAYELHIINGSFIMQNGQWGVYAYGVVNLDVIRDSYINDNGAAGNYGNIYVQGTGVAADWSVELLIENTDIEQAGQFPFAGSNPTNETGLYVDGVQGVTLINNYLERNVGYANAITYGPGVASITEIGNYISDGAITYNNTTPNVVSFNNVFNKVVTPGSRYVPAGTDISGWRFGPDLNNGGGNLDATGLNGMPSSSDRGTEPSEWNILDWNPGVTSRTMTCGVALTCPAGLYRLTAYMWTATPGTAGTVTFNASYKDGLPPASLGGGTRTLSNLLTLSLASNTYQSGSWIIWLDGVTDPTINFNVIGAAGNPVWAYGASLQKLF